tara:strand:+ start:403 stop:771 length:369 start_codon:yes stop_codon:yes gene_type:complete
MKEKNRSDTAKKLKKIEDIQIQINSIRSKTNLTKKDNSKAKSNSAHLGQTMQIGIEMAVGITLGAFAGFNIDKWLDSSPIMFIVFFLLGAGSGMLTSYRTIKKMGLSPIATNTNKKQEKSEK